MEQRQCSSDLSTRLCVSQRDSVFYFFRFLRPRHWPALTHTHTHTHTHSQSHTHPLSSPYVSAVGRETRQGETENLNIQITLLSELRSPGYFSRLLCPRHWPALGRARLSRSASPSGRCTASWATSTSGTGPWTSGRCLSGPGGGRTSDILSLINNQSWALSVFLNVFNDEKRFAAFSYQFKLTGSGLFKLDWCRNSLLI